MNKIINWKAYEDSENIRTGSVELQTSLHERVYAPIFQKKEMAQQWLKSGRTYWRMTILNKFEYFINKSISGKIIEIGAGTGWCSAILSQKKDVNEIYSLDYDPYCVIQLMPQVHIVLNANISKINYVYGSFNKIPLENYFDLVISIGTLHHSENLTKTLEECYKILKPGGYLLASEPLEFNYMSQEIEKGKEESFDKNAQFKYGKEIKLKENSDHYYRLCQYEASAYSAGFNVYPYVFNKFLGEEANDEIFKQRKCYERFQLKIFKPYFANDVYDRLMLILEKPKVNKIASPEEILKYEKNFLD